MDGEEIEKKYSHPFQILFFEEEKEVACWALRVVEDCKSVIAISHGITYCLFEDVLALMMEL